MQTQHGSLPVIVWLLLHFLFSGQIHAQESHDNYLLYSSSDGLDQNSIRAICRDSRGFLWVGTQGGVNRFDGDSWTRFHRVSADSAGMQGSFVNCIQEAPDQSIYIASATGHLERFDPHSGQMQLIFPREGGDAQNPGWIHFFDFDKQGRLWLATSKGTIRIDSVLDPAAPLVHIRDRDFPQAKLDISQFSFDPQGRWVGVGPDGLYRIQPGTDLAQRLYDQTLVDLVSTDQGFFALSPQFELWQLSHDLATAKQYALPELKKWMAHQLAPARDGGVWIASSIGGYLKWDARAKKMRHIAPGASGKRGYHSKEITTLLEDQQGILWLGSGYGLFCWTQARNKFKSYPQLTEGMDPGITDLRIWSVYQDSRKRIWVGTFSRGLGMLDQETGEVTWFDGENALAVPHRITMHVREDAKGQIWLGGDQGLCRLSADLKSLEHYPLAVRNHRGLGNPRHVRSFSFDDQGYIWAATHQGLLRFDPQSGESQRYLSQSALSLSQAESEGIFCLLIDQKQQLWLGTTRGLLKAPIRDGNVPPLDEFQAFRHDPCEAHSLNDNLVYSLEEDPLGRIWVGTGLGLNLLRGDDQGFDRFEVHDGLADGTIYSIVGDQKGRIWLGTNRGISRLDLNERYPVRNYLEEEGLQSAEFNSGVAFRSSDGEIFMGGHRGINSFYPDSIPYRQYSTPIVMTRVQKNGQDLSLNAGKKPQSLKPGKNNLRFDFAALNLELPQQVSYIVNLEGFDPGPRTIGNRRFVEYTNLPPGDYTFWVRSRDPDGFNLFHYDNFAFRVEKPWYQETWSWIAGGILLALMIWGAIRLQVHRRLRRIQALEKLRKEEQAKLRKETAQDFHDEMGHRLTKILFLSHELESKQTNQDPQASSMIHEIRDNCQKLSSETRTFIWTLDPDQKDLSSLLDQTGDFAKDLFDQADIHFSLKREGGTESIRLGLEERRHLHLILKEALHNTLKHSHAHQVRLTARVTDQGFLLSLEDNGKGFDPGLESRGLGLQNMRERAQKAGFRLHFRSEPEKGTTLTIENLQKEDTSLIQKYQAPRLQRKVLAGKIRVALVEDDPEHRQALIRLLENHPDMVLVGSYPDCESALQKVEKHFPAVLLLDMNLPGMSGLEALPRFQKKLPDCATLIYTGNVHSEQTFEALRRGAKGFLLKDSPPGQLIEGIREAYRGGAPMSRRIARQVVESFKVNEESPLSPRETEVLQMVASGLTFRAISEELFVERETIKTHIKRIYRKLEVKSKAEAIQVARDRRFI